MILGSMVRWAYAAMQRGAAQFDEFERYKIVFHN